MRGGVVTWELIRRLTFSPQEVQLFILCFYDTMHFLFEMLLWAVQIRYAIAHNIVSTRVSPLFDIAGRVAKTG